MEVYQKKHRYVSWTLITLFPALKMKCVYNDKETKVDWYKPYGVIFSKYIDIYIVTKSAWVTEQDNSQDINAAHWGGGGDGYIPVIEIQFNSIKREIY